ncbi:Bestrophin, RFP-TM, chloride channel-domain-containing protein [Gymnopilus junonius]|uniref:Bestrophin, RFP-TM, chloride channel-domain-containing protein n=1 Tax=Gymnopilus junonius TaxID=109634 RepID=A0A9P5TSY9_GYMJU|nr:Bestrophin, RFP-TM, chloride channel-domain-containing protein [Gymnopilus junonius]
MVAKNPLFHGTWTAKKLGATVVDDIWPEVGFFTLIATMVVLVSKNTRAELGVSNQLLTVLGLVLGLVISFRTSSAYERYQDGRKMWTTIIVASKNLAQLIWIHVPVERRAQSSEEVTVLANVIEKKTMINLVQAFSVSVKARHLLRGEQGVYYEDLYPLVSFLPRYANALAGASPDEDERLPLFEPPGGHKAPHETHVIIPEVEPKGYDKDKPVNSSGSDTPASHASLRRQESFNPEALLPQIESDYPLRPARNPPAVTMYDYFPILKIFPWHIQSWLRVMYPWRFSLRCPSKWLLYFSAFVNQTNSPHFHISYSHWLMKQALIQPAIATAIATAVTNNILLFQDTVSNLERICNTPLPFAYQAHLRVSLWIYLALLPFQIYTFYGFITIPATAFASFLLLGFLEIGQEIENPFNYDLNDLDLDHFCLSIQRDLHEITTHVDTDRPSKFVFSRLNQPFAPSDRRTAEELTRDKKPYHLPSKEESAEPGVGSIRRTLVRSWRRVDTSTREK